MTDRTPDLVPQGSIPQVLAKWRSEAQKIRDDDSWAYAAGWHIVKESCAADLEAALRSLPPQTTKE